MDRKDWYKYQFRNIQVASTYANKLNAQSVVGGGHIRYIYIANAQHLTIVRHYLNSVDGWKDSGLCEAPEEHRP